MAQDEAAAPGSPGAEHPPKEQPKIHVDADWKKEAQAEKERLSRQAAAEPAAGPAAGAPKAGGRRPGFPPATFVALLQTLATQAAIFMSDERDPDSGRSIRNLDLAKHNIDLLGVLEEKTKGNLTDDEKKMLDRLVYELRMAYVSAAS